MSNFTQKPHILLFSGLFETFPLWHSNILISSLDPLAILICVENTFWRGAIVWNFRLVFKEAWELYFRSGTNEKVETAIQALGGYSLMKAGQLEGDEQTAFKRDLLRIILCHRLRALKPFVSYQKLLINVCAFSPPRRSTSGLTKNTHTSLYRCASRNNYYVLIYRLSWILVAIFVMKFSLVALGAVFLNGVVTKRKKYDGLNLKFAGAWLMVHTNVLVWKMEFIGSSFDFASSHPRPKGLESSMRSLPVNIEG